MKIEQIDKNFVLNRECVEEGVRYYKIPHSAFALYGVFYDENLKKFRRMEESAAKATGKWVDYLANHTSGGRLRFSTDSKKFVLRVAYDCLEAMSHMTLEGQGGFILLEETKRGPKLVKIFPPTFADQQGYTISLELSGKMRNYILYFPLYNAVNSLEIGLDEQASVCEGKRYREIKPIVYYGSSITQGGCASRPDNCYQALISKWNNIDYINLGFSGCARGEEAIADYLPTIESSLFVCDYDYNANTPEDLEKTHYRLYERYRAVRPDTPILFISRPNFKGTEEDKLREGVVCGTYERAKAQGDNNVYFLAGKTLFGPDRENCTVDGCHPNDLGFYRMAKKIYAKMKDINESFR